MSSTDASLVRSHYDLFTRHHLDTGAQCRAAGMSFLPFVVDAHGGGLRTTARQVVAFTARAAAAKEGTSVEASATMVMRHISVTVPRENARAILRRLAAAESNQPSASPSVWVDLDLAT